MSLVGSDCFAKRQRNILILEGTGVFHSEHHCFSLVLTLECEALPSSQASLFSFVQISMRYADLTEKNPLALVMPRPEISLPSMTQGYLQNYFHVHRQQPTP
jgi:hypothetical protein